MFRSSTPSAGAVGAAAGGVLFGAATLVDLSEEAAAEVAPVAAGAAVVMGAAVAGDATDAVETATAGVAAGAGAASLISWKILKDCYP